MRLSFENLPSVSLRRLRSDVSSLPYLAFLLRGIADAMLPTQVCDLDPSISLFQDGHNLGFTESTDFHENHLGAFCQNTQLLVCP